MTTKTAADSLKVAIPHASPAGTYTHGQIVSADDPGLLYNAAAFVPLDTPDDQMPHPLDSHIQKMTDREARRREEERQAFEAAAKANRRKLQTPDVVQLTKDVMATVDGVPTLVLKGSKVHESHPLVTEFEDLWKPV
jgi:hypothetical protein